MSAVRAFVRRLAGLCGGGRSDRDIVDELAAHRDLIAAELRAAGLPEDAARRAAAAKFGSVAMTAGVYRDRRSLPGVENWLRDGVYAARSLGRAPGLALSMVLVLGLGIGLSAALGTVFRSLAWQTLPVPEPERVVKLSLALGGSFSRHVAGQESWFSYPEFSEYHATTQALESIAAVDEETVSWRADTNVRSLAAALVTGDYFRTLRVAPVRGRLLTPGDAQQPLAIVSARFWTERLAGQPDVVGSHLILDGAAYTVIGVAAPGFVGTEAAPIDVWLPLEAAAALRGDGSKLLEREFSWLQVVGRIAPGASLASAAAEGGVIAAHLNLGHPGRYLAMNITRATRLDPALLQSRDREKVIGAAGAASLLMGVLLLICGSNVAGLLLARGAMREKEIALRIALGATRGRVAQQLMAETAIIAAASALLGACICTGSLRIATIWLPIRDIAPTTFPDWPTFGFALACALVTAFLFGLAPIRQALRVDCLTGLKGDHAPMPVMRLRRWLVSMQVAVSVVLLVAAAWCARGIERAFHVDPGYATAGLFIVQPDRASIPAPTANLSRFTEHLREALREQSGVTDVGRTLTGPFWGNSSTDVEADTMAGRTSVHFGQVDDEYFHALDVLPIAGRFVLPTESDAVVVNASLARRFWGDERAALGHVLRIPGDNAGVEFRTVRVVGVVPTLQTVDVGVPDGPTYYLPARADDAGGGAPLLLVRANGGTPVEHLVADAVQTLSPGSFARVVSVDDRIATETGPARLAAGIAALVGLLALLVASVGIHGIVAHAVTARTREIGIRLALGAPQSRVLRGILGSSLQGVLVGALTGGMFVMIVAGSFSPAFKSALFGLNPLDPAAFLGACAVLVGVISAAAYIPARRALDVAPTDALRHGT